MAPPLMCDSATSPRFHGCLAFLHRHFPRDRLPHIPSIHLAAVNNSPRPGIAPQSLNSSCLLLSLLEDQRSCLGYVRLLQGLSDSHSIQAATGQLFTLSLKCFSSDSDSCPALVIGPLLQFPLALRAGPVLLTVLFLSLVPLSYRVLCGSPYSFPLVRYSCPSSAGVLSASTSVSDDVFLMYPWREMYATSAYSSPILFFYSLLLSELCILNDSD